MKDAVIMNKASLILKKGEVGVRLEELRAKAEEESSNGVKH